MVAGSTTQTSAGDRAEEIRRQIHDLVAQYHTLKHATPAFEPGVSAVPVSGRVYGASDMQMLADSMLDFWLTTGRFNDAFEKRFAERVGAKHVITVNSGSSANLVAFSALTSPRLRDRQLKPGHEVITAATGFPTTVNPTLHWGLVPVFVDVKLKTYNIDPDQIEAAITPKTRAIMVAHTLGNPFDIAPIKALCDKHGLFLVEDCCDALGATYDGKHVGTFGDVGTCSFYPAHHITMGEGGAVFMNNTNFKKIAESFRDWGRDCYCEPGKDNTCLKRFKWKLGDLPHGYDHKYIYSHLGFNLKITDMQAAVGLAQMDRLEGFIADRKRNFATLKAGLQELEEYLILPEATARSEPSWFGFPITVQPGAPFMRDELVLHLNDKKIATRLLFGGNLIRQPYMIGREFRTIGDLPNANLVVTNTFWIGVYPGLGQAQLSYVLDVIRAFCKSRG
ncbi:MAG: lipopolysaccharide biosynthesis protein RfbH [Alphaproteobacteria bacterium]|nr:lipopolysaccharide biosynthesis protein RfbH [Alphaproteobacteria bacterium]